MRTTTRPTTGESTASTTRSRDSGDGAGLIRANTSWAFAGNASYAACQWLVFVLLVKSLDPARVGEFAYALALTGPVFVLGNLRLRNLVATGVMSPHDFSDYLAARILTSALAVVASAIVAQLALHAWVSSAIVLIVACAKVFDAVSDICHGLFQRELDMRSAAIGLMANGILSVGLVAATVAVRPSLEMAVVAYGAASLLALAAWDLPRAARYAALRWSGAGPTLTAVVHLIRRALPLGLSSAVGSVQINVPRYVVAAHLGPTSLAVFTALSYIPTLGNLVVNATAQAALPVLARHRESSLEQYMRTLRTLVVAGTVLGLSSIAGTALFGRRVLLWVYSAEYAGHMRVLLWLMCAAAVSYSFVFLGTASTARHRFGAQLCVSSASLLAVTCLVIPLVARYGLRGAAFALLAGAAVEGAGYVLLTVHDLKGRPHPRPIVAGVVPEGARW